MSFSCAFKSTSSTNRRKQLSLRTPVPAVWLQLATFAPALGGVGTPAHCCDQDFRVEAKGLEPSNLLTASQQMYRPGGGTQCASVQLNRHFR